MKSKYTNPTITIGITTFKRPELLKETVHSVLSQEYENFRVIIGNDNPSEKITFQTLGIEKDSRIEIYNYEKNIGEVKSMNYMLSMATSEWFSWLADDDILHPKFISKFIEINEAYSKKNLVAVLSDYIESSNSSNFINNAKLSNESKDYDFDELITDFLKRKIKLVSVYGFLKTNVAKEIGGLNHFGNGLPFYNDTGFLMKLAEKGRVVINRSQLFLLRRHEGSFSTVSTNIDEINSSELEFMKFIKPIFKRKLSNKKKYDQFIFMTVKWLSNNNLGESLRRKNQTKFFSLLQYIYIQKKWLRELKTLHMFIFILFIFFQIYIPIFQFLKFKLTKFKQI